MAAAAAAYLDCRKRLTAEGKTIGEEIAGDDLEPFAHYPRGDVYDPETHCQYYFHLHRAGDHGHFHTFLRAGGMPSGLIPEPSRQALPGAREPLSHLIAIGLDRRGEPGQLFTTNRWVTAETWYKADHVAAMLPRFRIGHAGPSPTANRWLESVVTLFRPQIARLLAARDAAVESHRRDAAVETVLENRAWEVLSSLDIDIDGQIERAQRNTPPRRAASILPD
jgi:hypothetical protein